MCGAKIFRERCFVTKVRLICPAFLLKKRMAATAVIVGSDV